MWLKVILAKKKWREHNNNNNKNKKTMLNNRVWKQTFLFHANFQRHDFYLSSKSKFKRLDEAWSLEIELNVRINGLI